MRHVLDTCVIVSALRSRNGASHLLLQHALRGNLPVVCHYKLLAEYREVLARMLKQGSLAFTATQIERLLGALISVSSEVHVRFLLRPNLPDECDNFVYELAFAASPAAIVTHNIRDFRRGELAWPGVHVKTPQQVIEDLRSDA